MSAAWPWAPPSGWWIMMRELASEYLRQAGGQAAGTRASGEVSRERSTGCSRERWMAGAREAYHQVSVWARGGMDPVLLEQHAYPAALEPPPPTAHHSTAQHAPLALVAGGQQEGAHGGGQPHADGAHVRADVPHRVKHRHACKRAGEGSAAEETGLAR